MPGGSSATRAVDGAALVAAHPQFQPAFEFKKVQAFQARLWVQKFPRPGLDKLRGARGGSAPVHHRGVGLVFKLAAQVVVAQMIAEFVQPALRFRGRLFQFPLSIRMQALGPVQAPHFERRVNDGGIAAQQRAESPWRDGPVITTMRVRPCRWMRPIASRTPVQGRALVRSTRNGAKVPS